MVELRFDPVPEPQVQEEGHRAQVTHYLRLPRFIDPGDLEFLVQCLYPRAQWEIEPQEELSVGSAVMLSPGALRVGSHSVMHGPYVSTEEHPAQFGDNPMVVYALTTQRERGDQPIAGEGDRDGIVRIFAPALPVRQELRCIHLLISLARRLDASVTFEVTEPQPNRSGSLIYGIHNFKEVTPDPQVNVDLTIFSDVWLEPQAALAVIHGVAPRAVFAGQGEEWAGPAQVQSEVLDEVRTEFDQETLKYIHEIADENDMDALANPEVASAYAIFITDHMGVVSIEIGGSEYVPPALEGIDWADTGVLEYRISWAPADQDQANLETPEVDFMIYRAQVLALIRKLTHALYQQTGGEVADQDGFLLDPEQL